MQEPSWIKQQEWLPIHIKEKELRIKAGWRRLDNDANFFYIFVNNLLAWRMTDFNKERLQEDLDHTNSIVSMIIHVAGILGIHTTELKTA